MKCRKCGEKAVLDLRRHNTAFCRDHFLTYFDLQVRRAIEEMGMFGAEDRILVAVSGGKDSLALWDVLLRLGYRADGLYIDLGIGEYSERSKQKVLGFVARRPEPPDLKIVSLDAEFRAAIPGLARRLKRPACSPCGLCKRWVFNRTALDGDYQAIATGHNLDDEAAVLLGNVLHWEVGYLGRQHPVLEDSPEGLARKVKPLIRLTERETAAYAVLTGIDYVVEECPMAIGARSIVYKELLNQLELKSPGAKHQFFFRFLEHARSRFAEPESLELGPCAVCGQATTRGVCVFCRVVREIMPQGAEEDVQGGGNAAPGEPPASAPI